jgi:uncharacterized protein (TIGR03437 family)
MPALCATFGTVVPGSGGASYADIVLDATRNRLYLVDSTANRIDVYSLANKAFSTPIQTDAQPDSIAMSPDGTTLYATAYTGSVLDIINLTNSTLTVTSKISLPASPEGVAVGGDGRVLISTVGNSGNNVLLVYDPSQPTGKNLNNVPVTPAAPTPPTLPAPSNTAYLSYHSKLVTTSDGNYIIGDNLTSTSTTNGQIVFVYDTASATVIRSRIVANLSNVLAVRPDNGKFMAGSVLFDFATLAIVAQENTANSPFAFPTTTGSTVTNFNTQTVQGGSVFSPDGTTLWAAFNFAPVANPAVAANVSRLMTNDPDNLLIRLGLELPENLSGKMVITAAGDTIYALSQSGFTILPISTVTQDPLIQTDSQVELLINDQCGVYAQNSQAVSNVTNGGKGKLTVSIQSYTLPNTGVTALGGTGGAGGTIVFNPGGVTLPTGPGGTTTTTTTTSTTSAVPSVTTRSTSAGATLTFKFSPNAAKSLGSVAPSDFLIQAPEAVNIAPNLRIFQNNRNSDAMGTILVTQQNISAAETLMDMVMDTTRQRIYIPNSGMNQIEVVDMTTNTLMTPIKVGQLPHSLAMSSDGVTMYVANTGGESISIVNLNTMQTTGSVTFPPIPANAAVALAYPTAIAYSEAGPQFVESNGSLWKIDGTTAVPRTLNPQVFGGTSTTLVSTVSGGTGTASEFSMAGTPAGEYVLLVTGAGNAYLYDASVDDYTKVVSLFTTAQLTGFLGPIAAGPKGAYYVANGTLLNSSLTPIAGPPGTTTTTTGTTSTTTGRPVPAVTAVSASTYAIFSQPILSSSTSVATDAGEIQLVDATTGNVTRTFSALEGPESTVIGTGRATISGRTMVVNPAMTFAYVITSSGISVIPLTTASPAVAPKVNPNGVVNLASYLPSVAPGGLISIFGSGLGSSATFSTTPLPTILGGTCVTLNNVAIPLELTSAGQINAQVPVTLAAGKYPLVVRSITNLAESQSSNVTVAKYAPAVFVSTSGQAAIVKASDGSYVNANNPATRDEDLVIYGTGFGVTTGGQVTSGNPAPSATLAVTAPVSVYFGEPGYSQSPVIVEWSGLVPGFIGVNQINVRIPGTHMDGNTLPVTITIGGISSPATGPAVPTVALN